MMESVIRLENFYFAYNKSGLVLQDIDLEIKKGSFTVIAGPSGAGKTTLCKAMTGIVPFYMGGRYNGDVQVLGESTKGRRVSDIAMRVGLMLEDYESQLVSLTAGEEVAFSLLNHGFAPEEVAERTRKALEDVGLPGREDYQLDELSGGQRQRFAAGCYPGGAILRHCSGRACFGDGPGRRQFAVRAFIRDPSALRYDDRSGGA